MCHVRVGTVVGDAVKCRLSQGRNGMECDLYEAKGQRTSCGDISLTVVARRFIQRDDIFIHFAWGLGSIKAKGGTAMPQHHGSGAAKGDCIV